MRVVFEERLAQAMASANLDGVQAEMEPDFTAGRVQLDEEMAQLSANSVRYHALSKGLSRYLSIASLIASSSRG